jgi:hypothetical protein
MFAAWLMLAAQGANISGYTIIVLFGSAAFCTWYGWRLSELWLDGDTLVVKGLHAFRVPLSEVLLVHTGLSWRMRRAPPLFVLGLAHPVGKVQKIRFLPANKSIEQELMARIHAAPAARKV